MKIKRVTGAMLLASGLLITATAGVAAATQNHVKPCICHPVEGNGETGYGWNLISPDEASKHIDEATGAGFHTRKDGRTDVYADEQGRCPGYPTPTPTPTPTKTETSTPTPTETETSTPTPTETETSTPTPTPTETETSTPTPTPTETETSTPTPTPTETETSTPTPTPTPTKTETSTPTPSKSTVNTPTPTATSTSVTTRRLAQTGNDTLLPFGVGLALTTAGGVVIAASRKRGAHE